MKKSRYYIVIFGIVSILLVIGATYAFFNYTRTGAVNNLGTGTISFITEQGPSLSITNMFPISSEEAGNNNLDTITVEIKGNTSYNDGEEFVISIVDVENQINSKHLPITYIASYVADENKSVGSSSNDYWNARNSKNSNIYLLNETGNVREDKQILVGYIDNEGSGIEGTLTIKAFIDSDRMVITDTYPSGRRYYLTDDLTQQKINTCANYLASAYDDMDAISDYQAFCSGTDYDFYGDTFQGCLNVSDWYFEDDDLEFFLENDIIYMVDNGTSAEWTQGRTVVTTDEWNSFNNTPLSFKIKAESNEGIWVENPSSIGIDTCPGCKFLYATDTMYTSWNTMGKTPTVLTSGLSDSYLDIIDRTNRDYFLGVKLNSNNQATNIYACGIKNKIPFCVEGYNDSTVYNSNKSILTSQSLWGDSCNVIPGGYQNVHCGLDYTDIYASINNAGNNMVGYGYSDLYCFVGGRGNFDCEQMME